MKKIYASLTVLAVAVIVLNGFITQASNRDSFMEDAATTIQILDRRQYEHEFKFKQQQ